ncbi:hypothetical protein Naga_101028g1 [Nannochloropsis gaditana]|uniref:Uncharacterized protein n=1 Tax=Nannochloropsis gaditana TaxID=72520 RepID=W7TSH0_9STRA|nr:hypothetical protein Naga_101028g1 [Nannochloropsis gaditana]
MNETLALHSTGLSASTLSTRPRRPESDRPVRVLRGGSRSSLPGARPVREGGAVGAQKGGGVGDGEGEGEKQGGGERVEGTSPRRTLVNIEREILKGVLPVSPCGAGEEMHAHLGKEEGVKLARTTRGHGIQGQGEVEGGLRASLAFLARTRVKV